jgi:L-threonine kinase
MKVKVKAPGSCGELVQGQVNGIDFLVTCPIGLFSEVTVTPHCNTNKTILPKMDLAIQKTLEYLKVESGDFAVQVHTQMPVGKGMASSSADISAVCQGVALCLGRRLTVDEIADIALAIEPTDGIFYPGITMFDHVRGRIRRFLGEPLPLTVAVFDLGGEVDTLCFNRREDLQRLNREKEPQVVQALAMVREGLIKQDVSLLARGATLSALANQTVLFKPQLNDMLDIALSCGAAGVNVAHSGTVVGILFPSAKQAGRVECIRKMIACCKVDYLTTVDLISGGLQIEEGELYG